MNVATWHFTQATSKTATQSSGNQLPGITSTSSSIKKDLLPNSTQNRFLPTTHSFFHYRICEKLIGLPVESRPRKLILLNDGASDYHNRFVIGYCFVLIAKRIFDEIEIPKGLTGHCHDIQVIFYSVVEQNSNYTLKIQFPHM